MLKISIMKHLLFYLFGIIFLFTACDDSPTTKGSSNRVGFPVAGPVGKILVVCDDTIWKTDVKAYIDTFLMNPLTPYYPGVPTFTFMHQTPEQFEFGLKRYRNIFFINVDPNYKEKNVKIEKRTGVWALDQTVIDMTGGSIEQLIEGSKLGMSSIHDEYDRMSWERLKKVYDEKPNLDIDPDLSEFFGIKLSLPEGSKLVNKRKDFFRIDFPTTTRPLEFTNTGGEDKGFIVSGVFVYQSEISDSTKLNLDFLLRDKDTMLKKYAPYEIPGMYMGTQYEEIVYPVGFNSTNYNSTINGFDIRGMYVFIGRPIHAPGGCFWSFTFEHKKRKKLITISGFLDAPPTTSWIHFLREIQAVLHSVEIVE